MGNVARASERAVLRGIWTGLSPVMGSGHPNYRQALWSPFKETAVGAALSEPFEGVKGASKWRRRSWTDIGVMAVRNRALEELLEQPGARPAVAFKAGSLLVVGELADPNGFGRLTGHGGRQGDLAHGFRLGPGASQFAMGVTMPDGEFVTPEERHIENLGRIPLEYLRPGLALIADVNFS